MIANDNDSDHDNESDEWWCLCQPQSSAPGAGLWAAATGHGAGAGASLGLTGQVTETRSRVMWHRDTWAVMCRVWQSCSRDTWQLWQCDMTYCHSPECYIVCCITLELVRRAVRVVTLRVMSFKDCLFLLSSSDIWYIDLLNISIEEQAWTDSWLISIIHSIVLSVMMATDIFKSSLHAIIFKKL